MCYSSVSSVIVMSVVMTCDRKLQHKNLVKLYGVCTKKKPIMIVTEYMKSGLMLHHTVVFFGWIYIWVADISVASSQLNQDNKY